MRCLLQLRRVPDLAHATSNNLASVRRQHDADTVGHVAGSEPGLHEERWRQVAAAEGRLGA